MSKKKELLTQAELLVDRTVKGMVEFKGLSVVDTIHVFEGDMSRSPFRSDFFVIFLVKTGQAEVRINNVSYTLVVNDVILGPPNAIKQLVSISKDCTGYCITFKVDFLNQLGLPRHYPELINYFASKNKPYWKLSGPDAANLITFISDLFFRCKEVKNHPYGKEMLNHTFFRLMYELAALATRYSQPMNEHLSRKEHLVMQFATLVNSHFREQRSVQFYAGKLHITPKYLTETVKEVSGKNARDIIDDFVVLEAKLLLDMLSLSVGQVAEKLNFSDQSFFGKFFKRKAGISPKEYRTLPK